MVKYSFESKKKVVQEYLDGKGGYEYLAKKYNLPAFNSITQSPLKVKNYHKIKL